MATRPKELTVEDWFSEIDRGLTFRRKFSCEPAWHELLALYYNQHESQREAAPNVIYSTGDALLSALTVPYPKLVVKPRRMDFTESARVVESLDNMLICDLAMQEEMEYATTHAFCFGKGILKLGYDSEFGYDPLLDIGPAFVGQELGLTMSQFNRHQQRIEFQSHTRPGMPWVRAVMPHDIVVPWGVRSLEDAPWIAHRIIRHIDDIRSDAKYENTKDLQPSMSMEDWINSYKSVQPTWRVGQSVMWGERDHAEGSDFVELWEIHDRRTGKIIVIASGFGTGGRWGVERKQKFLRNSPDPLQQEGLPFVELGFVPKVNSFWVTPDAYYLRFAQAELIDIRLQSQKQRRANVLKFLYRRDLIKQDELEKLLSKDVGVAVAVEGSDDLSQAVQPFQAHPDNLVGAQEAEFVRRDARETVGFSRNQMGEYEATGRRTATEAAVVDQNSQQRLSRRHIGIQRAYYHAFRKLNSFIYDFWTAPRVAEIVDQFGLQQWIQFTGSGIRGEYALDVSLSNETPQTRQMMGMQAMQMYPILAQDPGVDPLALRQWLVSQMNDPSFARIWKPEVLSGQVDPYAMLQQQQAPAGGGQGPIGPGGGQGRASQNQNLLPAGGGGGSGGGSPASRPSAQQTSRRR